MAEWLKAVVLKTIVLETVPGVRIPLPPFSSFVCYCVRIGRRDGNIDVDYPSRLGTRTCRALATAVLT